MALDDLKYSIRVCDSHGAVLDERYLPYDAFINLVSTTWRWPLWPPETTFLIVRNPETTCTITLHDADPRSGIAFERFVKLLDTFTKDS